MFYNWGTLYTILAFKTTSKRYCWNKKISPNMLLVHNFVCGKLYVFANALYYRLKTKKR